MMNSDVKLTDVSGGGGVEGGVGTNCSCCRGRLGSGAE